MHTDVTLTLQRLIDYCNDQWDEADRAHPEEFSTPEMLTGKKMAYNDVLQFARQLPADVAATAPPLEKRRHSSQIEKAERIKSIARLRAEGHRNEVITAELGLRQRLIEQNIFEYGIQKNGRILYPHGLAQRRAVERLQSSA